MEPPPIHYPATLTEKSLESVKMPEFGGALISQVIHSISVDLTCSLPHSDLARLYRNIETVLPQTRNRIVQFVSAYEGEGAKTIAFETAIIAARLIGKRVLFVDTTINEPGSPRRLPDTVGIPLDTLLMTGRTPYEAIAQVDDTELYIATLYNRGEDGFFPAPMSAIEAALTHLRYGFDLIVIDSQQVLSDAFSLSLSKLADGAILVVEAERTRSPVVAESKRLIEASGGRVIGAVLNRRRFYIPHKIYKLLFSRRLKA